MDSENDYVKQMLDQYMISDTYGFLNGLELPDLPEEYNGLVDIASNLPQLSNERRVRERVDALSTVSTEGLSDHLTLRHARAVLVFITHGYVWQEGAYGAPKSIPEQLAVPLVDISTRLDLPPIITNADAMLINYRPIDPSKPLSLDNIKLRYRICGDETCDWFFLITLGVELECIPVVKTILRCHYCIEHRMVERAGYFLDILSKQIENVQIMMSRTHEQLDAKKFYDIVRPYLNGWHEHGMIYAGVSEEPIKVHGGSAAQCSGIQAMDIFLGIQHEPEKRKFLLTMRDYMPPAHRKFLYKLETICHTKDFVKSQPKNATVTEAYNNCVQSLVKMRSHHLQLVVKYVTIQAAQSKNDSYGELQRQGTGGQELVNFLKNIRSTTQTSMLDSDSNH